MSARLRTGATLPQARAEELSIVRQPPRPGGVPTASSLTPLAEALLGGSRPSLLMLSGAVGFLLLIACANVGNLLFAKGAEARRAFAVRFALGASRRQLARLMLVQSWLTRASMS